MKKKRVIPVLLLRNGFLVQSKNFTRYQNLGNPITAVKRLGQWAADELIYLDISKEDYYDLKRDDLRHANRHTIAEIIEDISKEALMPITVGGRLRSLEDMRKRLLNGADKIAINTIAIEKPNIISEAAQEFGSQCVVLSIDAFLGEGVYKVMKGGHVPTELRVLDWAKTVADAGAGEILLNVVNRDGMKSGYDIELIHQIVHDVPIPVIAMGGAGEWEHLRRVLQETRADAVAAANIFHFTDQSVYLAKKYLYEHGCPVRPASLLNFD